MPFGRHQECPFLTEIRTIPGPLSVFLYTTPPAEVCFFKEAGLISYLQGSNY